MWSEKNPVPAELVQRQAGAGRVFLCMRKSTTLPGVQSPALVEHMGVGKGLQARTSGPTVVRAPRGDSPRVFLGAGGQSWAPARQSDLCGCPSPSWPEPLAVLCRIIPIPTLGPYARGGLTPFCFQAMHGT